MTEKICMKEEQSEKKKSSIAICDCFPLSVSLLAHSLSFSLCLSGSVSLLLVWKTWSERYLMAQCAPINSCWRWRRRGLERCFFLHCLYHHCFFQSLLLRNGPFRISFYSISWGDYPFKGIFQWMNFLFTSLSPHTPLNF